MPREIRIIIFDPEAKLEIENYTTIDSLNAYEHSSGVEALVILVNSMNDSLNKESGQTIQLTK